MKKTIKQEHESCCSSGQVKGGESLMKRRVVLWAVIAVLFFAVLIVMFKTGNTGNAVAVQSAASAVKSAAAPAMVGGC